MVTISTTILFLTLLLPSIAFSLHLPEIIPAADDNLLNNTIIEALDDNVTACDCGWRNSASVLKIFGGQETGVNEFPAMAALIDLSTSSLKCGSIIISTRFVVTAAHCLYGTQATSLGVLAGDHNIAEGNDTPYAALYGVSEYVIHPNYDSTMFTYDIGILYVSSDIQFSLYVAPICLPFRYRGYDFTNENVIILGWGQLEFSGPTSDTLQGTTVNVISNTKCNQVQNGETVISQEICTYSAGKDSCQYDSGGPLFWTDTSTNRMHLIGIISHGPGCGMSSPAINTRVGPFLDWIVQTTNAFFCYKETP